MIPQLFSPCRMYSSEAIKTHAFSLVDCLVDWAIGIHLHIKRHESECVSNLIDIILLFDSNKIAWCTTQLRVLSGGINVLPNNYSSLRGVFWGSQR